VYFIGVDVGAKGAVAALNEQAVIYAHKTKLKSTIKGTDRLIAYGTQLRQIFEEIKEVIGPDTVVQSYLEEPPKVRNMKTYAVLMQYLAVAMVSVHQAFECSPVTLTVPTWKSLIDCSNHFPLKSGGRKKSQFDKAKNEWLKTEIKTAVAALVVGDSWNIAEEAAGSDKLSDVYDAVGIALAGRETFRATADIEIEL